ncbi:hypothetical protein RS83_00794 [Microbacterium oxydans]|uniref:Lipocalin-like domain-containing protein n=1 Tax=Microbacterium oxydans TaxID=82380 RepID=A0A0F0LBA7_9MICO|nr:hypothetical protein RS83_00794 [Microbacterium oxydans]
MVARICRPLLILTALCAGIVLLAACSSKEVAREVEASSLHGDWTATHDDSEATLSLKSDGSLDASGWPRNLMCSADGAATVEALTWGDTVDLKGTWRSVSSDLTYALAFSTQGQDCVVTGWSSYVWEDSSGQLALKIFLQSVTDPDSASDNQVLWLTKVADR